MASLTLCFDVYGTLVDPAGMAEHLAADAGDRAVAFTQAWREKQLEYSFRRGLMQHYVTFAQCTSEALDWYCLHFGIEISPRQRAVLLTLYQRLPPFPDAGPALDRLRHAGHRIFAFSNGAAVDVEAVLASAGLRTFLHGIVSVDDLRTFKPAPAVYAFARRATDAWSRPCCLVSGNAFDVIGARAAGMDAAWVRRTPNQIFDPWNIEPTVTVSSLSELADRVGG